MVSYAATHTADDMAQSSMKKVKNKGEEPELHGFDALKVGVPRYRITPYPVLP